MVVDHARGLHEGVADGGAHELEAGLLQGLGQGIALGRRIRHVLEGLRPVLLRLAADEAPSNTFMFFAASFSWVLLRYYGSVFARMVVAPALADLNAIIVAPDCPTKSWTDPGADRAVMALLDKVMEEHTIDRKRVLVVGFSMGGRGTWFMAAHHADLFTAAIPMAASLGDEKVEGLGLMPTYIIHSTEGSGGAVRSGRTERPGARATRADREVRGAARSHALRHARLRAGAAPGLKWIASAGIAAVSSTPVHHEATSRRRCRAAKSNESDSACVCDRSDRETKPTSAFVCVSSDRWRPATPAAVTLVRGSDLYLRDFVPS